jgi:FRG domain
MNIDALYSEWAKLRDWNLGPTIRFLEKDTEKFLELHGALDSALGPLTPASDDQLRFYATSPCHAAYALAKMQHASIVEHSTHLVFRGQRRSSWPLTPTLDRLSDSEETNRAILEVLLFCRLMSLLAIDTLVMSSTPGASFGVVLPQAAYVPAAQHYGLETSLLDFTADPAVAVYFASRDREDVPEEYASVYVYHLPLNEQAEHLLNLRLPPPFAERPYLQKGIYMESAVPGDVAQQAPWQLEVRFPVRAENHSFAVIRENVLTLLSESEEMEIILEYAKAGVAEFTIENAGKAWTIELIAEFSLHYGKRLEDKVRGLFRKVMPTESYIEQYVARVEDMLYWLCYVPKQDRLGINLDTLKLIARSNPEIVRMLLGFYRHSIGRTMPHSNMTEEQRSSKKELIEVFENTLRQIGQAPMSKPDLASWLGIKT